jgi:acylphosphatase
MSEVRAAVRISGRVQGVWFRQSTKQTAERFDVRGWVRNNPDRSVEAIFEGEKEAVQAVLNWCQQGPDMARVDDLQVDWQPATGQFDDFRVC